MSFDRSEFFMSNTDNNSDQKEKVFCQRCGRVLRDEKSRAIGYGPSCLRILKKERSQQMNLFEGGEHNE